MSLPPPHPADPLRWNIAIAAVFAVLCAIRLTIPSAAMFDEVHYLPAARRLIEFSHALNMEHPPLGKQLIALGIVLLGDNPAGWRVMPLLFGVLALYGAMRAMWFSSESRGASILSGIFLATGFPLLVQARIAMLDIFMAAFMMLALWMCAGAVRENETARWRLAIAGAALGAAMASKWNAIPLAMMPGLAFLVARAWQGRGQLLTTSRGWPVGGMPLWEAGIWLGLLPLAVYAASYWVFLFYAEVPGGATGLVSLHAYMLDLQQQTVEPHPYQSRWWQWAANLRAIWYLYEVADGAQRGVVMMGNPLSTLAALPALVWCAWAAVKRGRRDCAAVFLLYAVSLGMWVVAPKPIQFFYHYLLPHCFAMGALALACVELRRTRGWFWPLAIIAATVGLFAWFYPILTAAPLDGTYAFLDWAWIDGWR